MGKSCPALSSEPGLILLTAQVVRGSVGLGFVTLVVHPLGGTFGGQETCDEFLGWLAARWNLGLPAETPKAQGMSGWGVLCLAFQTRLKSHEECQPNMVVSARTVSKPERTKPGLGRCDISLYSHGFEQPAAVQGQERVTGSAVGDEVELVGI